MAKSRLAAVLALLCACGSHRASPSVAAPPPVVAVAAPPAVVAVAAPVAAAGSMPAVVSSSSSGVLLAAEAPISLTASDGTGLTLTRLEARAVVEGPLAFTELHLQFQNPLDRRLEGRFAITLPDGAALSRFAMAQGDRWMEAEVVERQAARRAYEDFLHRRQDPALLENEGGNQFSARVFPIEPRGTKELIVAFSHEARGAYVLPLRGLPAIGEVEAVVRVGRPDRTGPAYDQSELHQRAWTPDRDLVVSLAGTSAAVRSGDLIAIAIDPLASAAAARMTAVTVMVDTSASRALGFAAQLEDLSTMIATLAREQGGAMPLVVAGFDQQVEEVYRGRADGFGADALARLRTRAALGASDLAGALGWAGAKGTGGRVVLVTDAVGTVGDEAAALAAAAALAPRVQRVDAVLVGGLRDRAAAARLVAALPDDGAVIDGARGPVEVARRLGLATRSGLAVKVEGAQWVWPETLDGVQPGDVTVVLAALSPAAARAATITVSAGDTRVSATAATVPRPLLERAAIGVELARLEGVRAAATDRDQRAKLARRMVELSTRHRVMSPLTSFLVLETEADYARFGIARTALADILEVGKAGVELRSRKDVVLMAGADAPAPRPVGGKDKAKKEATKVAEDRDGFGDDEVDVRDQREVAAENKPADPANGAEESGEADGEGGRDGHSGPGSGASTGALTSADLEPMPARVRLALEAPRALRPPPSPAPGPQGGESAQVDGAVAARRVVTRPEASPDDDGPRGGPPPWTGTFAEIMATLERGRKAEGLAAAWAWRQRDPGDVLALIALGEAFEADAQPAAAARAYGSVIDLFPARADLRRFAAERLERVGAAGRALAIDSYRQAVASRPDHLTGHRLLAYALVRAGDLPGAFAALETGLAQSYPGDRFRGGARILSEDLGIVGAAWQAKAAGERAKIAARLAKAGAALATAPSLRFILYWETDANDVDFHIRDGKGRHAFFRQMQLASGGELYADVTTGYGPECFAIPGAPRAYPYQLQLHYYSRGPMGYGMGVLEVLRHDGKGGLGFEHRPYVIMADGAFVDLGTVTDKTAAIGSDVVLAR